MLRPRLGVFALTLFGLTLSLGCSAGGPVSPDALSGTTGAGEGLIGATRPALHLADNGLVAGTTAMGVYTLRVADGAASLEPAYRQGSLTGAKFEIDLTAAQTGEILTRCPDCFRVTGVRSIGTNQIAVGFALKHPIVAPDGVAVVGAVTNRNDLHINNVRLVALIDGTTEMFPAAERVTVNMDAILNADGYTKVAPVVDLAPIFAADVFPFITLGDADPVNRSQGNFVPGIGSGTGWELVQSGDPNTTSNFPKGFNALAQGATVLDELNFDLGLGATGNFTTNLVILASYMSPADTKATRLSSRYFMPEGAIQQSPHVEIAMITPPAADAGSPGSFEVRAVDFQQTATVTGDPVQALTDRDYSKVWADGRIELVTPSLGEYIANVNNFLGANPQPASFDRNAVAAAPGAGSYASPKALNVAFTNVQGVTGQVRVGAIVQDSRRLAPILDLPAAGVDPFNPNVFQSLSGLKEDLNVFNPPSLVSAAPLLMTYQFATFEIGGVTPPTGGIVIPDTPARANPNFQNDLFRNGLAAAGNNIYACWTWQGNDDSALFVARSSNGGRNWGAPVKVSGDAIANTEFEGRGFNIVTVAGGAPALVGIDVEEDVVFLLGANTGADSTSWPTGAANRKEVLVRGDGRNFNVSAATMHNDLTKVAIVMNRRETLPATSNEVQFYMVEGIGGALTSRKVTEAGGGVIDNGPDATASRFDADVATDASGRVHFLWKDNGDSAMEYRTVLGAALSLIEGPFPGKFLPGQTRPNLAVNPANGQAYVVLDFDSNTILSDTETDRDVFIVTKTSGPWSAPVQVNEDALDREEKEAEVAVLPDGGGGIHIAVVFEADMGTNARRIFLTVLDATLTPGSIVRTQLTPDPTAGQDRLDPKVVGNAGGEAVVVWEAKKDGAAGQSAVR